jgi:hypothetical protein
MYGDTDARTGHDHAGTGYIAGVDRIAQRDVCVPISTQIADRREPRQRYASDAHSLDQRQPRK